METYDGPLPSDITLTDTAGDINGKVNAALQNARMTLKSSGGKGASLCEEVYKLLGATKLSHIQYAMIELWANALPQAKPGTPGKIYQFDIKASQYKGGVFGGLAPVMQVNDIRFGTDKIGHFFQLGYDHYYERTVGKGALSRDDAIRDGSKSEEGSFGLDITGVYSNADIAANKAGMKFYEDLARNPNLTFDIKAYISSDWNEVSNPNDYKAGVYHDNIPGDWSGTFEWTDGSTSKNSPVTAKMTVSSGTDYKKFMAGIYIVEGTYRYAHPLSADTSGKLTGEVVAEKTAAGAVHKLNIDVEWVEGRSRGRGTLEMTNLSQMVGKWGRGGSSDNGGKWQFRKLPA